MYTYLALEITMYIGFRTKGTEMHISVQVKYDMVNIVFCVKPCPNNWDIFYLGHMQSLQMQNADFKGFVRRKNFVIKSTRNKTISIFPVAFLIW